MMKIKSIKSIDYFNKVMILVIFLLSSGKSLGNTYFDYSNYKNCIGDNSDLQKSKKVKIQSKSNYYQNGYNLQMVTYTLDNNQYSCAIVDENRHIIINELPTMTTHCEGEWEPNQAIWIDKHDPNHVEKVDVRKPSEILNELVKKKSQKVNVNDVLSDFKCEYFPYQLHDIEEINNTAYYLLQLRQYRQSIEILNQIIHLDPSRAVAYFNIADAYAANGQKDLAIQNGFVA